MNKRTQINKWTLNQLESFKCYYKYLYLQETITNIICICYTVYLEQDVWVPFAITFTLNIIMASLVLWLSRRTINEDNLTKECLLHHSAIVMIDLMVQYRSYGFFETIHGSLWVIICNVYIIFESCFFNVRYDLTMTNYFVFNMTILILTFKYYPDEAEITLLKYVFFFCCQSSFVYFY